MCYRACACVLPCTRACAHVRTVFKLCQLGTHQPTATRGVQAEQQTLMKGAYAHPPLNPCVNSTLQVLDCAGSLLERAELRQALKPSASSARLSLAQCSCWTPCMSACAELLRTGTQECFCKHTHTHLSHA